MVSALARLIVGWEYFVGSNEGEEDGLWWESKTRRSMTSTSTHPPAFQSLPRCRIRDVAVRFERTRSNNA